MKRRTPWLWGAGSGLGLGALGMAWTDAALVGLVVLVTVLVLLRARDAVRGQDAQARWPRAEPAPRDGARREVNAVTWSFGSAPGAVSEEAVRRLRADAGRRLGRRGVVLPGGLNSTTPTTADPRDVERARALLGEPVWAILTSPGGYMPSLAEVSRCVEAIELLHTGAPTAPTPPERRSP